MSPFIRWRDTARQRFALATWIARCALRHPIETLREMRRGRAR